MMRFLHRSLPVGYKNPFPRFGAIGILLPSRALNRRSVRIVVHDQDRPIVVCGHRATLEDREWTAKLLRQNDDWRRGRKKARRGSVPVETARLARLHTVRPYPWSPSECCS